MATLEEKQEWMRERYALPAPLDGLPHVTAFERHFTPRDLANLWHLDESTIRRLFQDESGVLKIGKSNRRDGKRDYVSLRIPESVAAGVVGAIRVRRQSGAIAAMLNLWRRHTPTCPHRRKGCDYVGNRCPIWVDDTLNEKRFRRATGHRDWQRADAGPECGRPPSGQERREGSS